MGDTGRFRAMGEKEDQGKKEGRHKDMPVYDPDHLPYETHHACVLLRELADQIEEDEQGKRCQDQREEQNYRQKGDNQG